MSPNFGPRCFTTKCIQSTVDYFNSAPVGEALKAWENEDDSDNTGKEDDLGIPLSRTTVLALPYLLPFLTCAMAVLSSLLICKGKCVSTCSVICANCSLCFMFVVTPVVLILMGVLWPALFAVADTCSGIEGVGYQVVEKQSDICDARFNGVGDASNCLISETLFDNYTVDFAFDVPATYDSVLRGQCSSDNDPIQVSLGQAGASVQGIPTEFLRTEYFEDNNSSETYVLEDGNLGLNMIAASDSLGEELHRLIAEELSGSLGCESMSSIYDGAKSSMCCGMAGSAYWLIASWYLIAWSTLCCGIWAGLLGRKRFPGKLWGRHYKASLEERPEDEGVRVLEVKRRAEVTSAADVAMSAAENEDPPSYDDETGAGDDEAIYAAYDPSNQVNGYESSDLSGREEHYKIERGEYSEGTRTGHGYEDENYEAIKPVVEEEPQSSAPPIEFDIAEPPSEEGQGGFEERREENVSRDSIIPGMVEESDRSEGEGSKDQPYEEQQRYDEYVNDERQQQYDEPQQQYDEPQQYDEQQQQYDEPQQYDEQHSRSGSRSKQASGGQQSRSISPPQQSSEHSRQSSYASDRGRNDQMSWATRTKSGNGLQAHVRPAARHQPHQESVFEELSIVDDGEPAARWKHQSQSEFEELELAESSVSR